MTMSKLTIIPTPVGNLGDITLRALEVLKKVDLILAEDTRVTGILLKHYGISKKMMSYHQHNEHKVLDHIIALLTHGTTIGLVSDAGTPGISDPGFLVVRKCREYGIPVECLPGPTAFIPALVNSGIACDRFLFEGFLPQKKGRQTRMKQLSESTHTVVLYESPNRLVKTLEQFAAFYGEQHKCSVSRELSKIYEETVNGSLAEMISYFSAKPVKGEIVIILEGRET